ncbi:methyl-accepting chemotaxis protein [Pseudomonas syringae pv. actinidiae ICMP 19099]|uniref:Methyl-accepting chemotaxis protein n=7 Tax=Pseudomonas syringae TaxID=317 RepID=A0A3M4KSD8_PSESF|nr:methyl-accepting chemotaxis protein [Pseudomonas syringae]EPN28173.1 methyl-accepting chemotaxis protein [Pseudomonas syringae pv. actinidiae ICMP 19099]EPN44699.1 methyl-accepting chemotaxis protein [Pseudomonas syringae pv. actinidiae ICMP 19095]EPN49339.1 methyl-accepting chemotaxis protein [Pseudomonas syringae pv. actinidiae ICMP 19094]KTC47607.1 chemotaxis protein [Pseudomonas syringae pv. actinidiae ICMP 19497]OOK93889.1 methyl-accepting chemotaxis protein [Pseudomonas syringae pv. a
MSLRNMNIAPRAFLGFAMIGTLMLILGVFALSQMNKIRGATEDLADGNVPSIKSLDRFAEVSIRLRVLSYRLLVNRDPETQQKTIDLLAMRNKQITDAQAIYEKLISDPNERNLYGQYVQLLGQYRQLEERLKTLTRANKIEELQSLLNNELLSNSDQMNVVLGKLVEINTAQLNQVKKDASREYDSAFNMVIGLLIAATLLTIVFAWMLIKSITTPIATALHAAETIAKGNLTQPIQIDGSDEAGRLLLAMKTMQDKLRDTLQGISGSATQLASAAEELNAVTDESARGLVQQNNEIEQAATAVNEMTSAVEEVARNAVSTSQASRNAATSAGDGRDLVQETVSAIERMSGDVKDTSELIINLASESRDIGKVLDVIRGLADQTNLLALNAAIEAARAGEAGRGIAVVADEVRALAHRTQQSTSEIERMIGSIQSGTEQAVSSMRNSTERAESTLNIAKGAGMALNTINVAVEEINERNMVIASAAEEQAQVAREVDRNLVNIRDLSAQSTTGANQTSAASTELSRLAVDLNSMVSRFAL